MASKTKSRGRNWFGTGLAGAAAVLFAYWTAHYHDLRSQFQQPTAEANATITEIESRGCRILDHCVGAQHSVYETRVRFIDEKGETVTATLNLSAPSWDVGDNIEIFYPLARPTLVTTSLDLSKGLWAWRMYQSLATCLFCFGIALYQWFSE